MDEETKIQGHEKLLTRSAEFEFRFIWLKNTVTLTIVSNWLSLILIPQTPELQKGNP